MEAAFAAGARVVLTVTFSIAAALKLRAPRIVRAQMEALFAPLPARVAAMGVPPVELAVAGALAIWWCEPWPAVCAAVVLAMFTAVLVRANARGVPCPCFGAAAPAAAGPAHVLRNGWLLALAVLGTGPTCGAEPAGAAAVAAALGALTLGATRFAR